jgi:hypothetical protein
MIPAASRDKVCFFDVIPIVGSVEMELLTQILDEGAATLRIMPHILYT